MTKDLELLRKYAQEHSEEAFAELVDRHLDFVYSVAFRRVRCRQMAEEVVQSVFTDLAQNAPKLKPDSILTDWLYHVSLRTAVDFFRRETRRRIREQIAAEQTITNAPDANWREIEPLLDDAMEALEEVDRTAILLRYFQKRSLRDVGQILGTTEDAAQKRVSRALEKLREFFERYGVTVGANGLGYVISANAVHAAPSCALPEEYRRKLSEKSKRSRK
jgi:RNA polymerase sigma factor (sigma-70 family)